MQNLELDTFEYEEDTSIGTLQIEQVENGTKIMVEFFPCNQSKESFENAEFCEVYDIIELAPLTLKDLHANFYKIYPSGITHEQEFEINSAIMNGVVSLLETILNLNDFEYCSAYPILYKLRKHYLLDEVNSFLKYRAEKEPLSEDTDIKVLEDLYRITDTINETDQTRTQNIIKYMNNLEK